MKNKVAELGVSMSELDTRPVVRIVVYSDKDTDGTMVKAVYAMDAGAKTEITADDIEEI